MSLKNEFRLHGNLGQDAEIRFLPTNGKAVATISLATNVVYTDRETQQKTERADWFRLSAYGHHAEFLQKWGKTGLGLLVVGEMRPRDYDHKTLKNPDGSPYRVYTMDFVIRDMLVTKWPNVEGGEAQSGAEQPAPHTEQFDDDIPY